MPGLNEKKSSREPEKNLSGQMSSKAGGTAEPRTERSRLRSGSKTPGRVHRQPQALGSRAPVAGLATYRGLVEACSGRRPAGWRPGSGGAGAR